MSNQEAMKKENVLGILGYDFVEFYVGSAKMVAYWFAKSFGFQISAYMGPETGVRDRCSYFLTLNKIRMAVTSALSPATYEVQSFVTRHGDGVKRWTMQVNNVEKAFHFAIKHGALPVTKPHRLEDADGYVEEAAIRIYDDSEIGFTNADHYRGIFRPGYREPVQKIQVECAPTGLQAVDHIVGNVRENEMDFWAQYFNKTLDFETFIHFGPGDISTKFSALLSKVVRDKNSLIKNPINEPYEGVKRSQIEEFINEYQGSGIQHVAITTNDIVSTIRSLRKNGVEFLTVPRTYYELLREKKVKISEKLEDLEELGILCDYDMKGGNAYLLQLFTKPIGDRPTFFFEIIQRCRGSESFGQGNFQALFESIERDQAQRGSLDK